LFSAENSGRILSEYSGFLFSGMAHPGKEGGGSVFLLQYLSPKRQNNLPAITLSHSLHSGTTFMPYQKHPAE
jgi:hypothetical protein